MEKKNRSFLFLTAAYLMPQVFDVLFLYSVDFCNVVCVFPGFNFLTSQSISVVCYEIN